MSALKTRQPTLFFSYLKIHKSSRNITTAFIYVTHIFVFKCLSTNTNKSSSAHNSLKFKIEGNVKTCHTLAGVFVLA